MSKNPRQIRRGPGGGARRDPAKPPTVVSQGVLNKTETARKATEPDRPKVLYGAALERERFVSRLPVTAGDVQRHRLNLALYFVAGVLALAFAGWTVFSAVQEAAAEATTTPIWPSIIAGVAGFFAMYFIFLGVREWQQGPRAARAGKRGKRR